MRKKYATMYDKNGVHQTAPRIVLAGSRLEAGHRLGVHYTQIYEVKGEPILPLDFETCRLLAHQLNWREIQANEALGSISFESPEKDFLVCVFPHFNNAISLYPTTSNKAPRVFLHAGQGQLGAVFIDPKQMYDHD